MFNTTSMLLNRGGVIKRRKRERQKNRDLWGKSMILCTVKHFLGFLRSVWSARNPSERLTARLLIVQAINQVLWHPPQTARQATTNLLEEQTIFGWNWAARTQCLASLMSTPHLYHILVLSLFFNERWSKLSQDNGKSSTKTSNEFIHLSATETYWKRLKAKPAPAPALTLPPLRITSVDKTVL